MLTLMCMMASHCCSMQPTSTGFTFLNATGCDRCEYCDDCSWSDLTIAFVVFGIAAGIVIVPFVIWLVRRKMGGRGGENSLRRNRLYAMD